MKTFFKILILFISVNCYSQAGIFDYVIVRDSIMIDDDSVLTASEVDSRITDSLDSRGIVSHVDGILEWQDSVYNPYYTSSPDKGTFYSSVTAPSNGDSTVKYNGNLHTYTAQFNSVTTDYIYGKSGTNNIFNLGNSPAIQLIDNSYAYMTQLNNGEILLQQPLTTYNGLVLNPKLSATPPFVFNSWNTVGSSDTLLKIDNNSTNRFVLKGNGGLDLYNSSVGNNFYNKSDLLEKCYVSYNNFQLYNLNFTDPYLVRLIPGSTEPFGFKSSVNIPDGDTLFRVSENGNTRLKIMGNGNTILNGDLTVNGRIKVSDDTHMFVYFGDSTIALSYNTSWQHLTNTYQSMFIYDEMDGFTVSNDTFTVVNSGDYDIAGNFTNDGDNGETISIRFYNVTTASGIPIAGAVAMGGSGDYSSCPVSAYGSFTAGDKFVVQYKSDGTGTATFKNGVIKVYYKHE